MANTSIPRNTVTTRTLDAKDHAVLQCLRDGITSIPDIAAELGIHRNFAQALLETLAMEGHAIHTSVFHYIAKEGG